METTDRSVVDRHLPLALQDVDFDRSLAVGGGREDLRLLGRNGRVSFDELRHYPAKRFDSQRQRGHVKEKDVGDVPGKDTGLDRGSNGHNLVGIDAPMWFPSEQVLNKLLHLWNSRRSTDKNDLVDV